MAKNNKRFAAAFGQDLMRGEHVVGGGMEDKPQAQTASLKGGLVHGVTVHPYDGTDPTSVASSSGTSIFDPVLCELSYRWFAPLGGTILDPFAGGSVRGIVASKLGRHYIGIDLSERQIIANRVQATALCNGPNDLPPVWHVGDSRDVAALVKEQVDFVFTCPPYADLEVYSDDPKDLSMLGYKDFLVAYNAIIKAACGLLRQDRFAAIVVGDVRGKDGCYYGFPWHTCKAFVEAGLKLYNEAILVTAVLGPEGSLRQDENLGKLIKISLFLSRATPKGRHKPANILWIRGFTQASI